MMSSALKRHNENRKAKVMSSIEKTLDETMAAFRPQTRRHGDVPNLSSIPRKPEPLGMELNVIVRAVTGIAVWLELQREKCPMREAEFARESGATAGCTLRGCRDAKRFSPDANDENASDDDPHGVFFGDACFISVEVVCQGWRKFQICYAGVVKTAHSRFPKAWLEEAMTECPSGAHFACVAGKGHRRCQLDCCWMQMQLEKGNLIHLPPQCRLCRMHRVLWSKMEGREEQHANKAGAETIRHN
jgi:hypothetical protein